MNHVMKFHLLNQPMGETRNLLVKFRFVWLRPNFLDELKISPTESSFTS